MEDRSGVSPHDAGDRASLAAGRAVHWPRMKIYTRSGDGGDTGLLGGVRVAKDDPRVEVCGTIDEANAIVGMARATRLPPELDTILERIQCELFQVGAELACAKSGDGTCRTRRVGGEHVAWLEGAIDEQESHLSPLASFVLPGGTPAASLLHLARTVCRRAERRLVAARRRTEVRDPVLVYLNRLSDLLFVLARRCNQQAGVPDVAWGPSTKVTS